MNNKAIIEFGSRRICRILQVEEGVIHRGRILLNISKSECMGIGVSCGRRGDFCRLKWPERPIKCLGVYLTYDYDEFIKMN